MASSYLNKSLVGATSPGAGAATMFDVPRAFRSVSAQVTFTGSPSSSDVVLEATIDGSTWNTVFDYGSQASGTISALGGLFPVVGLRANLTSLSGGTAPTVSVTFAAVEWSA